MFFRRRVDLFNPLLAAGKEALWTALVLMIVLVGRAAWAQNQPPFVLVEVGPIAPVFGASSVLNPVTNKFYTNGVDGIHVLNLSTKSSTVPGTFGDNLQTWGPLAVNPVKNHIYVPVYDRGLFVIDGDTDTPTDIVVIPKMKPVSAIAVNSLAMPSPKWHDIMSYCDYEWLSDYTYRAVMDRLRAEEALPPPPPPPPPPPAAAASSSPGAAGAPSPSGTSRPAGTPLLIGTPSDPPSYVGGDFITIVGTADITQRTGAIRFVHRVQQAKVRPADRASPVRLRLIDRAGRTIEEVPVPFLPSTDQRPGEDVRGVVDAVIPANAELKAVELLVAGNVAARYEAPETAHLQSTEIRTSVTRTPAQAVPAGAGRRLQLEWGPPRAAAAVAPGEIRYDVQASRDGGRTWEVLANGVPNPSADVDLSGFANVREIELRVIANEGFESREIARRKVER
jgi:hypothetical protein